MRTFIAIDLDEEIKKNLSSLINQLDRGTRGVRWVSREGMHLTLKFLGEIEQERVTRVEQILESLIVQSRPFLLSLRGTGCFPDRRNPRVLWVGIREETRLMSIQSNLERELEKLGFPREKRRFHPHLTLGRVKSSSHLKEILLDLEKHLETVFGEMTVEKITFFMSTLRPTGAEYSIIREFQLK